MRINSGLLGERLSIEAEMARERASALKRIAFNLEKYLAELTSLETELRAAPAHEQPRIKRRHEEVREQTKQQLWFLIVQREAMGLNNHDDVYEVYKVPRSLTV